MSILDEAKHHLRITDSYSDALLSRLINSALLEYLQFADAPIPPTGQSVEVSEDVLTGIILMVQADYDGDPERRERYRDAARSLWAPYREVGL